MDPLTFWQLHDSLFHNQLLFEPRRIDVWLLSARIDGEQRASYSAVLSPNEFERAHRYRFSMDQDRSIVGRGGLRLILSRYFNEDPADLQFETGSHGKPALRQVSRSTHFSLSHAGDCVLIGVTNDAECGVDIEQPHPHLCGQEIAEHFFCAREVEWMKHDESRFIRLWTMKEAIMKALGSGLSMPLNSIDVVDVAEGKTSRLGLHKSEIGVQILCLKELHLREGYASSVAMIGSEFVTRIMPMGGEH